MRPFRDRVDAGRRLADALKDYSGRDDVVVLGLPRGGVPVAAEVAAALAAPLDVFGVRKLGVPGHDELAMGAIATGGVRVRNEEVVEAAGISDAVMDSVARRELAELERRERAYRSGPPLALEGKTVIVVDDGLATGSSMRAAVAAVRSLNPSAIIVAVPTAPISSRAELDLIADEVVCLESPEPFYAVGLSYEDFAATTDDEVKRRLGETRRQ